MIKHTITFCFLFLVLFQLINTKVVDLTLGKPLEGEVLNQGYVYYKLPEIPDPLPADKNVIFTVTPYTGDSDLYISHTTETPTAENHLWKDSNVGGSLIQINSSTPNFKPKGPYYIGVKAYTNASFTILAHISDDTVILTDGQPQLNDVEAYKYQYYEYEHKTPGRLLISLSAIQGDPDIFVSMITQRPTWTNHTWSHYDIGTDILTIENAVAGKYYIGITSFSHARFNILSTGYETIARIAEFVPIVEHVEARTYKYFKFRLLDNTGIDITVNKLRNDGDPDIFVSTIHEKPNSANHEWKGINYGDDTISIANTDPKFKTPSWYYIGVYGFLSVTFKLTVKHETGQVILRTGQSATGKITVAGKYNYFTYRVPRTTPANEKLTFAAFPKTGSIEIYSSKTVKYPTSENYDRMGVSLGSYKNIVYSNPSGDEVYYVAVKATTPSEFSIQASQDHAYVELKEGETHLYALGSDQTRYYIYRPNSPDQDIAITAHTYSGRVGVYVGYNFPPSPWNYTLGANSSTYRGVELVMNSNDPNRKPGQENFYVTVVGATRTGTSYMSLSASHSNSTVTLRDGQITPGTVELYGYRYYRYIADRNGVLSINLKSLYRNGSSLADSDIFVSKVFPKPSTSQYEWYSNRYGDDHLNIDATPGIYYIAVYGARFYGSQGRRLPYQISAGIEYESLNNLGIGTYGFVRKGEIKYYVADIRATGRRSQYSNVGVTLISGDTSLYVWDNATRPTNISYRYRDRGWPGNTLAFNLSRPEVKSGLYTYGVYGEIDSEYFIHAAVGEYEATLTINQPKLIELTTGDNYFRVAGFQDIIQKRDYYLNINFANVNWFNPSVTIYASQDERFPSEASFKWKLSLNNRNAHMLLDESKMQRSKSIYFNVVYNGRYRMRMRTNFFIPGEPLFVTQDQPQVRDLQSNEIGYYLVFNPPQSGKFKVVMESCNTEPPPKLYISSKGRRRPNAGNADMFSTSEGIYTQSYTNNSVGGDVRNYYVGTDQSAQPRIVSLYATTVDDIRPRPRSKNLVAQGVVEQNKFRISVPGIVYDEAQYPIVYAAYFKKVASFDDKVNMETACSMMDYANGDFGDFYYQRTASPNIYMNIPVESHSKYIMNVIAIDRYGVRSTYNPIKAEITGANSLLPGKSIQATSNTTFHNQFVIESLNIADGDKVVIVVTPYSGEPELFVSLQYPSTRNNAIYNATYTGPKLITIDSKNQRGNGPYYIGVSGYTNTLFSIMMYHSKSTTILLQDGVPQLAEVEYGKWTYFQYYLDDDSSFTVSVSPTVGDPDLFISHVDEKPSYSKHQWKSESPGVDIIHVSNSSANFAPNKMYYVGVYGFTKSIFSLTFTKVLSTELLTENLPHAQIVHGDEYSFFKFRLVYTHDVIISVKPLNPFSNGDPDLCVSRRVRQPTPGRRGGCQWTSENSGKDTLVIPTTDRQFGLGWYYISVKGYDLGPKEELVFTILATTSYHNETLLSDGIALNVGEKATGTNYKFFKFYYGYETLANHLKFTVSEHVGQVDVFVSDSTNSEPRREKHTYGSTRRGSLVEVALPNTIKEGWYYCGVLTTKPSNYTITASTNQVPTQLTYGAAYFAVVPSGFYTYFNYRLLVEDYEEDIIIATRSYNGDPDIYVASGYRPTKERFDYKSFRSSRADWVRIPSAVLKARKITLLQIGIYGFSEEEAAFSIMVYRSRSNLRLVNAHPVAGVVTFNEYQYYTYQMAENGKVKFSLQLTSPTPSNALLCVSKTTEEPNILDCDYLARGDGLRTYSVTIDDATAGNYYLGVYGFGGKNTTYIVTASTEYEFVDDGFDVYEQVDKDKSLGFKTFVGQNAKHVMTSVTNIKGRTILYANSNSTLPTPTSYMWKSTDWPGNSLYIDLSDKKYKTNTEWSFSVYGVDAVSSFLFSTQTSFGRLRSGIPRSGLVAKGKPAFFYMTIPFFNEESIYIQAKAYDGSCISLFSTFRDAYPNSTLYDHHSSSHNRFDTAVIKIKKEEIKDNFMINIGVYGCSEKIHRFEISVATETEPLFLPFDNLYIHGNDKIRPNSWYEVLTSSNTESLNVQLDVCDDIPVDPNSVFIGNSTRKFPITAETADFISQQNGLYSSLVSAKQNVKKNEQYKITVNLPGDRLFSVYTTTDGVDMRPNCSQISINEINDPENKPGERSIGITTYPVSSNSYPVTVQLYSAETGDTMINMETVCAVLKHGSLMDTFTLNQDQTHQSKVKLFIAQKYKINAIITDKQGRSSTCKNVDLPKGIDFRATFSFISVGSVLILLIITIIILYLIIGVIFKKIKYNSKGLDLIPNIGFWKDVPFLIGDGIMFCFTCGRKESKEGVQELDENPFGATEDTYHEI